MPTENMVLHHDFERVETLLAVLGGILHRKEQLMNKEDIANRLIANAFAIERTGFQNNHERTLCALLREAAVALGWKEKCVMCGADVMDGSIFCVGHGMAIK